MQKIDIKKIEDGFKWLQTEFESTGEMQSCDVLIQRLDMLNSCMAWSGEQMAIAKRLWNDAKLNAYSEFTKLYGGSKFSPSVLKDFIASYCAEAQYNYDLCERFTRTIVHISDNLRTAISSLKEQAKLEGYGQSVPAVR